MARWDEEAGEVIQLLGLFILWQILQQDNGARLRIGIWECCAEEKGLLSNLSESSQNHPIVSFGRFMDFDYTHIQTCP